MLLNVFKKLSVVSVLLVICGIFNALSALDSYQPKETPKRIIVLDPACIEILYKLGADDKIVGIAHLQHSNIEPADKTSKLTSVGSFSNPSIEKILTLKPDLVIVSSYSLALEPRLKDFNIPSLYLTADRLDDLFSNIQKLGEIVKKQNEAKALIEDSKTKLDALKKNPINKSAIFLFSSNPLMAFSHNSMIADILELIGVKNLTPQSEIKRPIISSEYILRENPDILLMSIQAKDIDALIAQNPVLKNIAAYKNNQIYVYENIYGLLRISPSIIDAISKLKADLEQRLSQSTQKK